MDFQINNQQQFDLQLQEFLDDLNARDYSEATVNGYKSFLKKTWTYISQTGFFYTLKASQLYVDKIIRECLLSESSKRHIITSIRWFNEYLSEQSYVFRQNSEREEPPEIFQKVLDNYIEDMRIHGLKLATIKVRRIFATQFLNSIYR